MPLVDFKTLTTPLAGSSPTGPDLDFEGDPDYMNFVARIEGQFPDSYFRFDRSRIAFDAEYDRISEFLGRTRDVRLLVMLAKLLVLNRDLRNFAACIAAIAALLEQQWDEVHPRPEDGDVMFRMVALQSLDDTPTVILPLQHVPLAVSRRIGPIEYRMHLVASGDVPPRRNEDGSEEPVLEVAALDKALMEVDLPQIVEKRDDLDLLAQSLAQIRTVSVEKAGFEAAVSFQQLTPLVGKMLGFLNGIIVRRDPAAAPATAAAVDGAPAAGAGGGQASAGPQGPVATHAAAAAALAAVGGYFAVREPSNPALLLVRQAEQLVGKSFVEVMRVLAPSLLESANFNIGARQTFTLPIERLAEMVGLPEVAADEEPDESASWAESGADGGSEDSSDEGGDETGRGEVDGATEDTTQEKWRGAKSAATEVATFRAGTRTDALALLDDVRTFYQNTEPSSPIPFLIDRARDMANRDFLNILRDLVPSHMLNSPDDDS